MLDEMGTFRTSVEVANPVQPLKREILRLGVVPAVEVRRDSAVVVGRDLPDEEAEEGDDEADGPDLAGQAQRSHAATMKTVVPTSTTLKSHSASPMYIRMQPCETE